MMRFISSSVHQFITFILLLSAIPYCAGPSMKIMNFERERRAALVFANEAVDRLVMDIPDLVDPIAVVHMSVTSLIHLLVEDGGYEPEDIHSLVKSALSDCDANYPHSERGAVSS